MLAFLHTAAAHVTTFGELSRRLAPDVAARHVVREDLLSDAAARGVVSEATRDETQAEVTRLHQSGARVVVCTCSTLGDAAEATPRSADAHVLRVDRPMAERAAALGRPILVVAALPTALDAALRLLQRIVSPTAPVRSLLCEEAWARFRAGDEAGYVKAVVEAVVREARSEDVVMLAQASLAPAAAPVEARGLQVLTSPELGVRVALGLCEPERRSQST